LPHMWQTLLRRRQEWCLPTVLWSAVGISLILVIPLLFILLLSRQHHHRWHALVITPAQSLCWSPTCTHAFLLSTAPFMSQGISVRHLRQGPNYFLPQAPNCSLPSWMLPPGAGAYPPLTHYHAYGLPSVPDAQMPFPMPPSPAPLPAPSPNSLSSEVIKTVCSGVGMTTGNVLASIIEAVPPKQRQPSWSARVTAGLSNHPRHHLAFPCRSE